MRWLSKIVFKIRVRRKIRHIKTRIVKVLKRKNVGIFLGVVVLALIIGIYRKNVLFEYLKKKQTTEYPSEDKIRETPPAPILSPSPSPSPALTPPPPTTSPMPSAQAAAPPSVIYWSQNRKLTLNDFQASVPSGAFGNASIAAKIDANWGPAYSCADVGGQKSCTVSVAEINIFAAFNPYLSWVKESQITERTLSHEQLHFDIVEVYARRAKEQTRIFLGQTETAIGSSEQAAFDQAATALDNKINPVIIQLQHESEDMNRTYDSETANGSNVEMQNQWNQKIRTMLGM